MRDVCNSLAGHVDTNPRKYSLTPYLERLTKACGVFLNFPSQLWSSMSVCILSKGVRTASVQPAQKAARTTQLEAGICLSWKTLLYCSNEPNMRAVVALFCKRGGRIPRYRLTIPSAFSWEAASQAEIPWSCWRNMVLLMGKVTAMLTMPLPHPAAYSLHSLVGPGQGTCHLASYSLNYNQPPGYFLSEVLRSLELVDIRFSLTIIVLSSSSRLSLSALCHLKTVGLYYQAPLLGSVFSRIAVEC